MHTATYIFFLYCSPSCSVVDAASNNIEKALICHPSANIICCGDFNSHKEWLVLSHETDATGIFCHDLAV